MLEIVSWFVIGTITNIIDCYIFSKLMNEKFHITMKLLLISTLFVILSSLCNYNDFIMKLIINNLCTLSILKINYNKSLIKTLIFVLFTYLIYVLSEAIIGISIIYILKCNTVFFMKNVIGILMVNMLVLGLAFTIFKSKLIIKIITLIIEWYNDNKIIDMIFLIIIAFAVSYILSFQIFVENGSMNKNIILVFILTGIVVFIFGYFKEKSGNNKLTIEYDQLLDYVKTYENEVVEKSKRQHEYNNQLVLLDDMIGPKNKKAKEYIKGLIDNNEEDKNTIWLKKLKYLPKGGLKGLVYYKIQTMIRNKIDVYIEIDSDLANKKNWNSYDNNLEDISRILGVYLDNAIEACKDIKVKQIIIEFRNNDGNIEFILSNTYNGKIVLSKIDKEKYSTKGKGRGYGLSLVKDIINKNSKIGQQREINGKFYVQKLTVKK